MKKMLFTLLIALTFIGCQENELRRPVSYKTGTFMKESAARNQARLERERLYIDSLLQLLPAETEVRNNKMGYWYYLTQKNEADSLRAKTGDMVYFEYTLKDLAGNTIYSAEELGPQSYWMDKQKQMTGLRDALKQLRQGEKGVFYFPSSIAYGYHGDTDRIGPNVPLLCELYLIRIEPKQ